MSQSYLITHDFLNTIPEGVDLTPPPVLDTRHYVYVHNPEYTIEMYLNYLKFVYALYNKVQPSYKGTPQAAVYMIQLGFLPVVFPPSFWEDRLHIKVVPKLRESGLPYYTRPASNVLNGNYTSSYPDIWVSKLDAAAFCHCKPEETSVEGVLQRCGL